MKNQKGFTLIELLVVVLIIGILAAMAMPQYFKAVERSRMTEAVTLLGNVAQSQQRKFMQINKFASDYRAMDVAPKGATGASYYTKTSSGNGFKVTLNAANNVYTDGYAEAQRWNNGTTTLQYPYTLKRYYAGTATECTGTNEEAQALCADFCGIDTPAATCCSTGITGTCPKPTDANPGN